MSKISNIYDGLYTILGGLFPNKNELVDGLMVGNNADTDLRDGYGFNVEDARNSDEFTACLVEMIRNFTIVITKEVRTTHQNKSAFKTAEKAMLEDQFLIVNALEGDTSLELYVNRINYISDTGLQRLTDSGEGHKQFMSITTTFEVSYNESISQ